jgi:uncharacterized SAM-binding protein YcdF (DUF218 family)
VTTKRFPRGALSVAAGVTVVLIVLVLRYAGGLLVVSKPIDRPDAIVVLASHEWERLPVAAELARQYPSVPLMLTLPADVTEHNCYECSERLNWLSRAGVDRHRVVVLPHTVTNTYDEANASAAFVHAQGIRRLVVVTSPYHGRRALATFRHRFREARIDTNVTLASPMSHISPDRWWLRRYDRDYVAYEWAGIVYYALRFGVMPTV